MFRKAETMPATVLLPEHGDPPIHHTRSITPLILADHRPAVAPPRSPAIPPIKPGSRPNAVLALPDGELATGAHEIRRAYERVVADRPTFIPGAQRPTLLSEDLALTSSRLASGAVTVEVACRQADGTWLWVIDQPNVAS